MQSSKTEIEEKEKVVLKPSVAHENHSALKSIRCQQSANSYFRRKTFSSKCFNLPRIENKQCAKPLAKNISAFQKTSYWWVSVHLTLQPHTAAGGTISPRLTLP